VLQLTTTTGTTTGSRRRKEFIFIYGIGEFGGRTHLIIEEMGNHTSRISRIEWYGNQPGEVGDRMIEEPFDELVERARRSGGFER